MFKLVGKIVVGRVVVQLVIQVAVELMKTYTPDKHAQYVEQVREASERKLTVFLKRNATPPMTRPAEPSWPFV